MEQRIERLVRFEPIARDSYSKFCGLGLLVAVGKRAVQMGFDRPRNDTSGIGAGELVCICQTVAQGCIHDRLR